MKSVIVKFQFIVGLILFACLNVQADDDLITKQITIKLDEAGTLPSKIGDTKKYKITNLKIVGEINGTDLRFIRDMAGCDYYGYASDGKLATLDLSEAKIVEGGIDYLYSCYTSNDVIPYKAFLSCISLTNIIIPSSVSSIDMYAFYNCISLTNITIPSSVTSLGKYAFSGCSRLTNITIPSNVTTIETSVFEGCRRLTSITIPSSVTYIARSAFSGCTGLTSITIPSSVTSLGEYAFNLCTGLTSITIPSSLAWIGEYAFSGCTGLTSITIPSAVISIKNGTFTDCTGLTSITIPSSVTYIARSAFSGCTGLTSITIPSSVASIGEYAFSGCTGLDSVYVSWDTPTLITSNTFQGVNTKNCILYIPKGSYDNYWLTDWGVFEHIVEYDVTGINNSATSTDTQEIARYSADGQRLYTPTKGLNIVKYSDGSMRKVMVR